MVTIKDVAAIAGVSPAAVSRYMNGGSISEEKKDRIREAIEETGYRPNLSAQTMRTGKSNQVGIIVPRISSESVGEIVDGISEILTENGYMAILGNFNEVDAQQVEYMRIMQDMNVDGIIALGTSMNDEIKEAFDKCRVPLVIAAQRFYDYSFVCNDDYGAVKTLTSMVINKGRKKIAFIGGAEDDKAVGEQRRKGAQEAFKENGLDPDDLIIRKASLKIDGGYEAVKELMKEHKDIDGLVCATDRIAVGGMKAVKEAGLRIPEDVSVTGVNDNKIAELVSPRLTTAHLYLRQCGREAAGMLIGMIEDSMDSVVDAQPMRHITLGYSIMERESL